jgi:hypothetical protein
MVLMFLVVPPAWKRALNQSSMMEVYLALPVRA